MLNIRKRVFKILSLYSYPYGDHLFRFCSMFSGPLMGGVCSCSLKYTSCVLVYWGCHTKLPDRLAQTTETYSLTVQKAETKKSASLVPFGGSERENGPGRPPGFWWRPAVLGVPWLVEASLPSLPPPCCPVSAHLSSHGLCEDISHWIQGLFHSSSTSS